MNRISVALLLLVALAVAGVVGLLVLAPESMIENPPGGVIVPSGISFCALCGRPMNR